MVATYVLPILKRELGLQAQKRSQILPLHMSEDRLSCTTPWALGGIYFALGPNVGLRTQLQ